MRVSLVLALTASSAELISPTGAATSVVAGSSVEILAAQFVELTFVGDIIIRRDTLKACADNARVSFLRDPQAKAASEDMPGLVDVVVNAGCSKLDETVVALLPELKARTAASYAARLTPAELGEAIAFYLTPTGKKLVDATPAIVGGSDLREILSPAELSQFAKFSRSSTGQKIEALKPRQSNDMSIVVNRAMTAALPKMTAAGAAAGQSYIRALQRKTR